MLENFQKVRVRTWGILGAVVAQGRGVGYNRMVWTTGPRLLKLENYATVTSTHVETDECLEVKALTV